jgi:hypothetical protein
LRVADITNLSFDEAHSSFALKSPANRPGLAEWLLRAMDKPAGWKPSVEEAENVSTRQYQLQPGGDRLEDRWPITRIHYLNTSDNRYVQEILTVTRVVAEIQRVFRFDPVGMIVFREAAGRADLGDWLIGKLDAPADGKALAEQENNPQAEIFTIASGGVGAQTIWCEFSISTRRLNRQTSWPARKISEKPRGPFEFSRRLRHRPSWSEAIRRCWRRRSRLLRHVSGLRRSRRHA